MSRYLIRYKKPRDVRVDTEVEAHVSTWDDLEAAIATHVPRGYFLEKPTPCTATAQAVARTFVVRGPGRELIAHGNFTPAHLVR